MIVCAHYDDHAVGTPLTYSPGVDDNSSGVAAVLEMARVLAHVPLESTVLFIALAAEEQGLQGSWHFADSVAARGDSIAVVLNMDMIANYVSGDWRVWIHKDARSAALAGTMSALAGQYTSLIALIDDSVYPNGDYWPFMADSITASRPRSMCGARAGTRPAMSGGRHTRPPTRSRSCACLLGPIATTPTVLPETR